MKRHLLAAAMLTLAATGVQAQDVVRLGTEGAYPPYNFINEQNEVDGFERDLGDEICRRANLTCEWVVNDWDSIIPNLLGGNYDAIIAGMSITDARREIISFTQNYLLPEPSAFVALAGAGEGALEGVVSAQSNTIQAAYVAEMDGVDLVEFATPDEAMGAVRNGEADAILADRGFLVPFVEESGGALEFVGEPVFIGGGIGIGVRQSDAELLAALDAAITSMREDGTLNELIVEWFDEGTPTFE